MLIRYFSDSLNDQLTLEILINCGRNDDAIKFIRKLTEEIGLLKNHIKCKNEVDETQLQKMKKHEYQINNKKGRIGLEFENEQKTQPSKVQNNQKLISSTLKPNKNLKLLNKIENSNLRYDFLTFSIYELSQKPVDLHCYIMEIIQKSEHLEMIVTNSKIFEYLMNLKINAKLKKMILISFDAFAFLLKFKKQTMIKMILNLKKKHEIQTRVI